MPLRQPRRAGLLLQTGQTTQYSGELDDGLLRKGLAKSYTILTAGQYAGTTNIDLAHYTGGAGAIAFDNVAKTITDTGNGLAIFKTGDVITTDAPNNPGPFTVTTGNVAGTITCAAATFVTETPVGAITISKREAHSNNCVLDNNTGLMWSRYTTSGAKLGAASDGKLPWTGQPYDVFQYAAAANAALLTGYADWRIPNNWELISLMDLEAPSGAPDVVAFPGWPVGGAADVISSSTTRPDDTTRLLGGLYLWGIGSGTLKTSAIQCVLVRGGA